MRAINREIIALAVPAIISNITTPLLGLADTAVTGHMGGAAFVGAIAVGSSMLSLAYWALNFLRMGTSGLTAQAYGASAPSDRGGATAVLLWRSLLVGFALSLLVLALSSPLADALLRFMDADSFTTSLARRYFMIVIFGTPAVLASYSISGWLLGMQDSKGPMWMAIATNITNIALSIFLVFVCGMGIAGVALGTLLSQWIGAILCMTIVKKKLRGISIPAWTEIAQRDSLKRFFSINSDIFFRTLCLALVTLWFTHTGAQNGVDCLSANALLMQLFLLFSYFMDGFAFAGEALAGKYQGMSDKKSLAMVIKGIFIWGTAIASIFTLSYAIGAKQILFLLTDEPAIVDTAMRYLPWAIAIPFAGIAAFVWDGVFIGLTLTRDMLISMATATAIFFSFNYLLPSSMGNHRLWLAFISYLFTRGLIQSILYMIRK